MGEGLRAESIIIVLVEAGGELVNWSTGTHDRHGRALKVESSRVQVE